MIARPASAARWAAAGAAVLSTVLLAACGQVPGYSSGGQSPAAAGTGTVSASATPSPPPSTPPSSPPSSPASASPATATATAGCRTANLTIRVAVKRAGAAAGSVYYPIDFTSTASTPCTLFGYPGVSFVTGKGGSEIGAPASRNHGMPSVAVTLQPGGHAHAILQVVDAGNYSASDCHPVTAHLLRVYPPNQTAAGYAPFTVKVCSARLPAKLGSPLTVDPVRAGKGKMGQAP